MRLFLLALFVACSRDCSVLAFLPVRCTTGAARRTRVSSSAAAPAVPLEPEPPGGIELSSSKSMAACRMKQLDEPATALNSPDAYKFWMTAQAESKLIDEIRATILRDASKKANFPGFRKGQVPPFAQPQITQFAVQEAIIKTVEAAVVAYGLKSLAGSDGEVKVHEEVSAMAKLYKTGNSVTFTATLNAAYDGERRSATSVVDVAAAVVDELETVVVDELETVEPKAD